MKKIGIITFHKADNYGAVLQAYALAKVCGKYGETNILNYDNEFVDSEYNLIRPLRKQQFAKSAIKAAMDVAFLYNRKCRKASFDVFRNEYIPMSKDVKSCDELGEISDNYTHVITGSDQVWSPKLTNGIVREYFLDFGKKNLKRISYAPSIGNIKQLDGHEAEIKEKLAKLNNISAREADACKVLSKISGKKVKQVVDPTILLDPAEWKNLLKKSNTKNEDRKYIFTYSVSYSPVCAKIAKDMSHKAKLPLLSASQMSLPFSKRSIFKQGPIGFLLAIKNAEMVITSSFHATVFSLIFHKDLIVVPHRSTGMRVVDLLEKCNLSNRVITSFEQYQNADLSDDIKWKDVDESLAKQRDDSTLWLSEALKG